MNDLKDAFCPDWVSCPGETISDLLELQGLSVADFSRKLKRSAEDAARILTGDEQISIGMAKALSAVLGGSAEFWMAREAQYRSDLERLDKGVLRSSEVAWLSGLPLKEMARLGWIKNVTSPIESVNACLRFFGVVDLDEWEEKYSRTLAASAFRTSKSFKSEVGPVAAWLRKGEIEAAKIKCRPWSQSGFKMAFPELRAMTRIKDPGKFIPELVRRCAEAGVAVVVAPAPKGCRASGATRFLNPTKALLMLSARHLSDDHFWFSFFHEAGHLCLHGQAQFFLDGTDTIGEIEESEANEFAANVLIPKSARSKLLEVKCSAHDVIRLARDLGIAPGIIVGQLQHLRRVLPDQLNKLKRRYSWTESS